MQKNDELLTEAQLGTRYGFCGRTISRHVRAGKLPGPSLRIGGQRRWALSDVLAWEKEQARAAKADAVPSK